MAAGTDSHRAFEALSSVVEGFVAAAETSDILLSQHRSQLDLLLLVVAMVVVLL